MRLVPSSPRLGPPKVNFLTNPNTSYWENSESTSVLHSQNDNEQIPDMMRMECVPFEAISHSAQYASGLTDKRKQFLKGA